jgi:hypothetical protein
MSEAAKPRRSKSSSQGKKVKNKKSSGSTDKPLVPFFESSTNTTESSPLYADPVSFKSPDPESVPLPKFLSKLITVGDSWTLAEKRIEVRDLLMGKSKINPQSQ